MALYHLAVKAISRSAGRSATAAAAYRAGCKIADTRTGEIHDYRRKGGVDSVDIVLPDGAAAWATDRSQLWNAAELAERRKDACVAREFEVALPSELSPVERRQLALAFAKDMAQREGCAVDVAIHAPGRGGDTRNHHAHILRTTRKVGPDGLGDKLDTEKAGRKRSDDLEAVRARWAEMTNARLRKAGLTVRVDHRSLADQGIARAPTQHLGPSASGYERRTGEPSNKRLGWQREAAQRLAEAKHAGEVARQHLSLDQSILDLSGDLTAAKAERQAAMDRLGAAAVAAPGGVDVKAMEAGRAAARAKYEAYKQIEAGTQQARDGYARYAAEKADHAAAIEALATQRADAERKARDLDVAKPTPGPSR